jgi:hydroxymethylpyrimidine pyrophosphatase-like HAD family hydrolase
MDLAKIVKPFNVVFDIDDTIIFDNGRSTPNLQVVELLRKLKTKGAQIHLVTARDQEHRQETILELKRSKIE